MNALEIRGLTKSYADFTLQPLHLTLPGGCVMGLVGENGAGKSTTIKLILEMIHKEGGSVAILGHDSAGDMESIKEEIGVVLDEPGIPECLTVQQAGKVMQNIYRSWNAAEYARLTRKLALPENKPFKEFSRGMKMKLCIAIAMSHNSRLLILDEATSGLDPVIRDEVLELFRDFVRDENHSILMSSHIVSDLEKLCDYVAFVHQGRLLLCEEKDALLAQYGLFHCTQEQLQTLPANAVKYRRENAYGVEAVVRRSDVPAGIPVSPISMEELFVFMVREVG